MFRHLPQALLVAASLTLFSPVAEAVSPDVQLQSEATHNKLQLVGEFAKREVDKFLEPTETLLAKWEKYAARKGFSAEDQAQVDKTTVEVLYTLGHIHLELGNTVAAEPYVLRALGQASKLGPNAEVEVSFAYTIAGKMRRMQGKYAEAREFLEKALTIRKTGRISHWDVRTLYYELAIVRRIQGDFKGARDLLLVLARSTMDEAADCELAALDMTVGDYKSVEDRLLRVTKMLANRTVQDPPMVTSLAYLSDYHLILGSPEQAAEPAKDLLARRENMLLPIQLDIADALLRLARIDVALKDIDHAHPLVDRAIAILNKEVPAEHPARISLLLTQAEIMLAKGDYPGAEKLLFLAHANAEKSFGANNYETARILSRLGAVRLELRELDAALAALVPAAEVLEKTLGLVHPDTTTALDDLARVYLAQKKSALALQILRKAMDYRDRHAARTFGFVSEAQKIRAMERMRPQTELAMHLALDLPDDDQAIRLALTAVLRRKGRVLDGMAMSHAALRDANSPDEKILIEQIISLQRRIVDLIVHGPQRHSPEEHRAIIRELDIQKQMLEAQESRMSQRRLLEENPVTVNEVAAALPKGSALVEYAVMPSTDKNGTSRYVAWVVLSDKSVRFVDIGPTGPIDSLVADARAKFAELKEEPKPLARKLDEAIMQPIRRVLGKTTWLFVSPDGDLNLVPFGALRDEFDHWLLDTYSFTYLTSGRDLLWTDTIDAPKEPGAPAVFFGNPDFGEKKLGRRRFTQREDEAPVKGARAVDMTRIKFTPLEGTIGEITALEKKIPGALVFMGDKATEAQVKSVKHPRILHLATHGFFLPDKRSTTAKDEDAAAFRTDNPLVRAGLALSGANILRSGEEDGVLTAFEAATLDLYGTKLVVLSACETGVGEARSGEGVYGLRRALAIAGAEAAVMSLWQVDDAGTRELMVGYYDRLMAGGGRAESLRQAALALKAQPQYQHPFFWASFIVSGDGTALSGKLTPPGPPPVKPTVRGCACEMPAASNDDAGLPHALLLGILAALGTRRRARAYKSAFVTSDDL